MKSKLSLFLSVTFILVIGIMASGYAYAAEKWFDLYEAMLKGDYAKMKTMIENNPKLINAEDKNGMTIIYKAFCIMPRIPNRLSTIQLFLEHGASLKDKIGRGCLTSAIMDGDKSLVELLLKQGADPNLKSKCPPYGKKMTALEFARSCKNKEIIELIENHIKNK